MTIEKESSAFEFCRLEDELNFYFDKVEDYIKYKYTSFQRNLLLSKIRIIRFRVIEIVSRNISK